MPVFVSGANAGVFCAVALPADFGVVFDAEVLRLGIDCVTDSQDDAVAVILWKNFLGYKAV